MKYPDGCASSVPQNQPTLALGASETPRASWALRQETGNAEAKLVLIAIAYLGDRVRSDNVYASTVHLAGLTHTTASEVERAVKDLTRIGLLSRNGGAFVLEAHGAA